MESNPNTNANTEATATAGTDLSKLKKEDLIKMLEELQTNAVPAAAPVPTAAPEDAAAYVAALRADRPKTMHVKLHRDNNRHRDDVAVSVNGKTYLIKRGVEVELPYNIGMVLMRSIEQDEKVTLLVDRLSSEARF